MAVLKLFLRHQINQIKGRLQSSVGTLCFQQCPHHICRQHTLITVPSQVLLADVKVMVSIQLPEFAVYDIKVLVGEVICDLIYVILFFQESKSLKGTNTVGG